MAVYTLWCRFACVQVSTRNFRVLFWVSFESMVKLKLEFLFKVFEYDCRKIDAIGFRESKNCVSKWEKGCFTLGVLKCRAHVCPDSPCPLLCFEQMSYNSLQASQGLKELQRKKYCQNISKAKNLARPK